VQFAAVTPEWFKILIFWLTTGVWLVPTNPEATENQMAAAFSVYRKNQ
jgi:hypothetical protein